MSQRSLGRPGLVGRERAKQIRQFILDSLTDADFLEIGTTAAKRFDVSRHTIHKQLRRLESQELIQGRGSTKARQYRLAVWKSERILPVKGLEEHVAWRDVAEPAFRDLPVNVLDICHYGFTEIVNNVIDHSGASSVTIEIQQTSKAVKMVVFDPGMGVFCKIQAAMNLPSLQEALFELSKGKLTTDPTRHTGEGIFFTSRAFDEFTLLSNGLFLSHERQGNDWLIGKDDKTKAGTMVTMIMNVKSEQTLKQVFDHYASGAPDDMSFKKTNVVLRLLDTGDDSFVSRSQARRVLTRLPRFTEVLLDFSGVETISPAFADEIFRVFHAEHPEVNVTPVHVADDVGKMIARAISARSE